jgi:hypothetical protein
MTGTHGVRIRPERSIISSLEATACIGEGLTERCSWGESELKMFLEAYLFAPALPPHRLVAWPLVWSGVCMARSGNVPLFDPIRVIEDEVKVEDGQNW